jgi:hypothetical protein
MSPQEVKADLRWAFNPALQIIWGLILTTAVGGLAVMGVQIDHSRIDPFLSPVALVLGLWVGYRIGVKRLRVLREILPEIDGRFIFAQWDVMMSVPEGATVVKSQGLIFGITILGILGIPTPTNGRASFVGSFALFGLGAFLAGKTLPFLRLWSELRQRYNNAKRSA